jgi:hypothetical protein
MNTRARLTAYAAALALLTGGAFALGSAVGPPAPSAPAGSAAGHDAAAGHDDGVGHEDSAAHEAPAGPELPGGLASSLRGYTLAPADPTLNVGVPTDFSFRIIGPDGAPVTAFDEEHTKRLHLIVVRRDTTGFQHLHPEMAADGTWRVPLTVPSAGSYRAFADFTPTGAGALTLGVDLAAAGEQTPVRHQPARIAQLDGYQVQLEGELVPGAASPLTLTVSRAGVPVTDLQPYLGAYGHLVALREGDLAYLHVHPYGAPGDGRTAAGPQIRFLAEVPSAATYRLFLDFQHAGTVRTAEFTLPTGAAGELAAGPTDPDGGPR